MMEGLFKLAHPILLYPNASSSVTFIVPSLLHVALSFILLGMCASDYLCPNVAQVSELTSSNKGSTRIREHSTGIVMAVLLSWCNSSPDLFSNLISWTSKPTASSTAANAAALSIGEVLGACGIILCIVEGSIFIIMSSTPLNITRMQRKGILKDLVFAFVAMLLMFYVSFRNKVTVLNCAIMCFIYIYYLLLKFSSRNEPRLRAASNTQGVDETLDLENLPPVEDSAYTDEYENEDDNSFPFDPLMLNSSQKLSTRMKPS